MQPGTDGKEASLCEKILSAEEGKNGERILGEHIQGIGRPYYLNFF
jgi:hypothetical protein